VNLSHPPPITLVFIVEANMDFREAIDWFILGAIVIAFLLGMWVGYSLWG